MTAFWVGGYGPDGEGDAAGIGVLRGDEGREPTTLAYRGVAAEAASPSWLAQHPMLDVVYAALEGSGSVQAFVRTGEAALAPLGAPVAAGQDVCHLAVAPGGAFLVASCYGDGRVVRIGLDAAGRLVPDAADKAAALRAALFGGRAPGDDAPGGDTSGADTPDVGPDAAERPASGVSAPGLGAPARDPYPPDPAAAGAGPAAGAGAPGAPGAAGAGPAAPAGAGAAAGPGAGAGSWAAAAPVARAAGAAAPAVAALAVAAAVPAATAAGGARASHAHAAAFLPDGRVATTDLGFDLVRIWRPGATGLALDHEVVLPRGVGPRHMVVHPSGHLHVVTEYSCEVFTLAASVDGTWHPVSAVPVSPAALVGVDFPAELSRSRDGETLYAGVRGSNTIAALRVRGSGESLEPFALAESGVDWPRHHLVHDGALLVAGQRSDEIALLDLDERTGAPRSIRHRTPAPAPTHLLLAR